MEKPIKKSQFSKAIKYLLTEFQLYPIRKHWERQRIIHKSVRDEKHKKDYYRSVETWVKDKNGLYCYFKGSTVLYIGKGNKLASRLKSHYRESYTSTALKSHKASESWHIFFNKNAGELDLYIKEIPDPKVNLLVEKMFEFIQVTLFMQENDSIKKERASKKRQK